MDFELSEEQKSLRSNAKKFVEKEIAPIADKLDKEPLSYEMAHKLLKRLAPFGYLNGITPREYGGEGLSFLTYGIMLEELARIWNSLAVVVLDNLFGPIYISRMGTDDQKRKFLPLLHSGEYIYAFALTESDAGSDLANLRTTAIVDGDNYIINGTKIWISNGTIADLLMALVRTDRGKAEKGTSVILVEKKISPFTAKQIPKMGFRALPCAEISFHDCVVPKQNLLGDEGMGYKQMLVNIGSMRGYAGIIAVGVAQASIDAAVKYAKGRYQFGKPIGGFQLIQEMIADMVIQTEAARLLTYRTLSRLEKGSVPAIETSITKAYTTEVAADVASKALQIHGAYGISEEYPVERYFRDARSGTLPEATTQIHKLLIAREILGIAAFR
jgi:alkylation response protein AidB-like acyl-CoA dehydrogenase